MFISDGASALGVFWKTIFTPSTVRSSMSFSTMRVGGIRPVLPAATPCASPYGYVGQGLAQGTSSGNVGLIPPTRIIEQDFEELNVDGVKMVFQNTPGTEAPS